jgi:hypothetical protein
MPNDSTPRDYPLPHPDNIAREDAERIRNAIERISDDMDGASEARSGGVRLATAAEAMAGTAANRVPVVARVKSMITAAINAVVESMEDLADDVDSFMTSMTTALGTKLAKSANLSDLTDKGAARTALELGAAALKGIATLAQLRAKTGTDLISVDAAWDAAAWVNLGNLTGAVTIDASTGAGFRGVLTGNVTIDVTNLKDRQPFEVILTQDATGGRTVSWNARFKWPSAAAPEVSTAASTVAVVVTGVAGWDASTIFAAGWKVTA